MNSKERQEIIRRLDINHYPVELDCDGYRVSLIRRPINPTTNRVFVYVNGWIKGRWLIEDCEERRRFMCPHHAYLWSRKNRERLRKIGKRALKSHGIDPDQKVTTWTDTWASSALLVRHMEQHNRVVSLIEDEKEVAA